MSDFFSKFKSKAPEYQNLGVVTEHPVRLVRWEETNSLANFDGTVKDNEPGYSDSTPQIVCIFTSAEGKGGIVHRFNGCGYTRYSELTPKQLKTGKILDIDGYACVEQGGEIVRISSEEKTKACIEILSNVFTAFGLPVGSGIEDLDIVAEEGRIALLTTKSDSFEGRAQVKVHKFRKSYATETV